MRVIDLALVYLGDMYILYGTGVIKENQINSQAEINITASHIFIHIHMYKMWFHTFMLRTSEVGKEVRPSDKIIRSVLMRYIPMGSSKDIASNITAWDTTRNYDYGTRSKSAKRRPHYTIAVNWLEAPPNGFWGKEPICHVGVSWNVAITRGRGWGGGCGGFLREITLIGEGKN